MSPALEPATDVALFLAGFIDSAEACRRLGLHPGELAALLDEHGLSGAAMIPVGSDDRLEVLYRDLGRNPFDRPLFDDVVGEQRAFPPADQGLRFSLSAGAILETPPDLPREVPAGMIFHVGRCGSNLLCNLLARVPGVVILREPELANALCHALGIEKDPGRQAPLEALATKLLRSLAHGVRQDDRGQPRRCVVKFSSWNALFAEDLLRRLPPTPTVVVVRAPWETVASYLQEPPYWYGDGRKSPAETARYFAGNWSAITECTLRLPAARTLIVSYRELAVGASEIVERVCHLFGLGPAPVDSPAISAAMQAYSKSASREPFDADGRHRRQGLHPDLQDLVSTITASSWAALLERTSGALAL